jgi:hypothetical protein
MARCELLEEEDTPQGGTGWISPKCDNAADWVHGIWWWW